MTSTEELNSLIEAARNNGAVILVTYDADARMFEGRDIIETVQVVGGVKGVGPYPMPAITAAERLRQIAAFHS